MRSHSEIAEPAEMVENIEPCEHMQEHVSALSDGSLHGPLRWYTTLHSWYCPHCRPALAALRGLHSRLEDLRENQQAHPEPTLDADRRTALHSALDAVDGQTR